MVNAALYVIEKRALEPWARVQEKLEEQRELAVGRARVAQEGIDVSALEEDEEERALLGEEALRRFEVEREPDEELSPPADAPPR